jgi:hypothetical protein
LFVSSGKFSINLKNKEKSELRKIQKVMKKNLSIFLLLTCVATFSVRADLIWYEGFNYVNGDIRTNSSGLWIRTSGSGNDLLVTNNILEVAATGGAVITRQDDDYRLLAITAGSPYTNGVQTLFSSFTVICTNLANGAGTYFASFYSTRATGGGFFGRIQTLTNGTTVPNTWRIGVSANASATATKVCPVDLALNTPYQVVAEWDPITLQAVALWINPIDSNDPFVASTDSIGAGNTNPPNAFAFRQAGSAGNYFMRITNLALATTFAEAATNIWATNALAPTIIYQPIVGITNFPTASISLSAVVNGQGLRNMTYQWQKSATPDNASPSPVSNPNGNSNVLPFSSAQTTDSGYYSLVATTPYGLSVTSTVANVSIVDGPYPPAFTVQPVSQTIFSGQSATLSTTVIEPPSGGTPAFTWYSNNVVVTAGQTDNGLSSSYAFINATTNLSATYKVAVTNAYGGIVSSNAVLSVLPIPAVSIAYLRTLVDPATFQPTNSPATIPYQITGVVTTLTNTTTGDTASYYLQDGTAGINIFATAGSTFRPQQGDVVTFVGVLSYFSTTGLELFADTVNRSYTSYSVVSNNFPLPTPRTISFTVTNDLGFTYVNTNLAGSLVTLTNVYFGTNVGNTISTNANTAVTVTNASGKNFTVQFFSPDQDTAGKILPAFATSVTGVLYGGSPNFSVAVTKFSDIVVPVNSIPLSFNYSSGNLTFNWTDASFSLQASTNVVGPYITISGAISGFITNTTAAPTMFFRLYHP